MEKKRWSPRNPSILSLRPELKVFAKWGTFVSTASVGFRGT